MSSEETFLSFARLCESLEKESHRKKLAQILADYLKSLSPQDAAFAAIFTAGKPLPSSSLNVSGATLWSAVSKIVDLPQHVLVEIAEGSVDVGEAIYKIFSESRQAIEPTLTLSEVAATFERMSKTSGQHSKQKRTDLLAMLFGKATPTEAKWIGKIISAEMRHGASEGIILDALANLAGVDRKEIEIAYMFSPRLDLLVRGIIQRGSSYIDEVGLSMFSPIRPMLATACPTVEEAFNLMGAACSFEYKLDGLRVQIHKLEDEVRLFSRTLKPLTDAFPEVCETIARAIKARGFIGDGEVIAVRENGTPLPFQILSSRITSKPGRLPFEDVRVHLYAFDVLLADDEQLWKSSYHQRRQALLRIVPHELVVPALVPQSASEAQAFFESAISSGYEGLVAKHLSSPYRPGHRGKHWLKIKKKTTLDLVIVAAEYGYGRRHGWLSNYLLAVRDDKTGKYLPVGKTFKGLSDDEFRYLTQRLSSLKIAAEGPMVIVKPEVVVEVSFGDIQVSKRYQSGFALRFARVERIREDKDPSETDTLTTLKGLFEKQSRRNGGA